MAQQGQPRMGEASFIPFCEAICGPHFSWDFKPDDSNSFQGDVFTHDFGEIDMTRVNVDPLRGWRRADAINPVTDNRIALTLYSRGGQLFRHENREVVAQTGEMVLWNGLRPCFVEVEESTTCLSIFFPRTMVDQHIAHVDDICGRKIGRSTASGRILISLIETLIGSAADIPPADQPAIFRSVLDMIGSCFRPDDLVPVRTAYQRGLIRRIEEHIRNNLASPLEPGEVAQIFGFSARYLHRLFAESSTTFSEVVKRERLAKAARMLASTSFAQESITSIAFRLGFCDGSYFSRVFKAQFGVSPVEFRKQNRKVH